MDLAHFALILSRSFWKAHLDPPLENLDKVFNRMASHVVAMLRDEGASMSVLLHPMTESSPDGQVDVIFSGDIDQVGTLPGSAVPSKGDYLELEGVLYRVEARRWIMETGRKVAVSLTLVTNWVPENFFKDKKDTVIK